MRSIILDEDQKITSKSIIALLLKKKYKGKFVYKNVLEWLKKEHSAIITIQYSSGGMFGRPHYNSSTKNKFRENIGGGHTHYKATANDCIKMSLIKYFK